METPGKGPRGRICSCASGRVCGASVGTNAKAMAPEAAATAETGCGGYHESPICHEHGISEIRWLGGYSPHKPQNFGVRPCEVVIVHPEQSVGRFPSVGEIGCSEWLRQPKKVLHQGIGCLWWRSVVPSCDAQVAVEFNNYFMPEGVPRYQFERCLKPKVSLKRSRSKEQKMAV